MGKPEKDKLKKEVEALQTWEYATDSPDVLLKEELKDLGLELQESKKQKNKNVKTKEYAKGGKPRKPTYVG